MYKKILKLLRRFGTSLANEIYNIK